MGIPTGVQVVAWVVLAGGVGYVAVNQDRLAQRVDAVERVPDATPAEKAAREVEAVEQKLAALSESEGKRAEEIVKIWAELARAPVAAGPTATLVGTGKPAPAAAADPAALAADPTFDAAVRCVIDAYVVERKFRDALQKVTGPLVPKKPAYPELAKALELKPAQSERFAQDVQAIQHELFDLLSMPRPDGTVLMEQIQQAEQYPEGSPEKAQVFLRLIKLTIPDTQETYFERAISLVQRVKAEAKGYFDEEQYRTLDTLDLDYFGIRFQ